MKGESSEIANVGSDVNRMKSKMKRSEGVSETNAKRSSTSSTFSSSRSDSGALDDSNSDGLTSSYDALEDSASDDLPFVEASKVGPTISTANISNQESGGGMAGRELITSITSYASSNATSKANSPDDSKPMGLANGSANASTGSSMYGASFAFADLGAASESHEAPTASSTGATSGAKMNAFRDVSGGAETEMAEPFSTHEESTSATVSFEPVATILNNQADTHISHNDVEPGMSMNNSNSNKIHGGDDGCTSIQNNSSSESNSNNTSNLNPRSASDSSNTPPSNTQQNSSPNISLANLANLPHTSPHLVPGPFVVMQGSPGDGMANTIDSMPVLSRNVLLGLHGGFFGGLNGLAGRLNLLGRLSRSSSRNSINEDLDDNADCNVVGTSDRINNSSSGVNAGMRRDSSMMSLQERIPSMVLEELDDETEETNDGRDSNDACGVSETCHVNDAVNPKSGGGAVDREENSSSITHQNHGGEALLPPGSPLRTQRQQQNQHQDQKLQKQHHKQQSQTTSNSTRSTTEGGLHLPLGPSSPIMHRIHTSMLGSYQRRDDYTQTVAGSPTGRSTHGAVAATEAHNSNDAVVASSVGNANNAATNASDDPEGLPSLPIYDNGDDSLSSVGGFKRRPVIQLAPSPSSAESANQQATIREVCNSEMNDSSNEAASASRGVLPSSFPNQDPNSITNFSQSTETQQSQNIRNATSSSIRDAVGGPEREPIRQAMQQAVQQWHAECREHERSTLEDSQQNVKVLLQRRKREREARLARSNRAGGGMNPSRSIGGQISQQTQRRMARRQQILRILHSGGAIPTLTMLNSMVSLSSASPAADASTAADYSAPAIASSPASDAVSNRTSRDAARGDTNEVTSATSSSDDIRYISNTTATTNISPTGTATTQNEARIQARATASATNNEENDDPETILAILEQHRSWFQIDGRLVILKSLPRMSSEGNEAIVEIEHLLLEGREGSNPCTLSPGSTVMAVEAFILDLKTLRQVQVPEDCSGPNLKQRTIQILKIESPHAGFVASKINNYSYLAPGLPSTYTDAFNWPWRVTCQPDGAFVRKGLELVSSHVNTLEYGSFCNVTKKVVNSMGLNRLRVDSFLVKCDEGSNEVDGENKNSDNVSIDRSVRIRRRYSRERTRERFASQVTAAQRASSSEENEEDITDDVSLDHFCLIKATGWISEFLNPLSGQSGPVVAPIPFPIPALYRVVLSQGCVIRSGVELSTSQIGHAPYGSILKIVGRAYSDHPRDQCLERLKLAGGGGWISAKLNKPPPEDRLLVEMVGVDGSFDPDDPASFHFEAQRKVMQELSLGMAANSEAGSRSGSRRSSLNVSNADDVAADTTFNGRLLYRTRSLLGADLSEINEDEDRQSFLSETEDILDGATGGVVPVPTLFRSGVVQGTSSHSISAAASGMMGSMMGGAASSSSLDHLHSHSNRCLICLSDDRTSTIVHGETGHIACCLTCARILKARGDKCPVCRLPIDLVIQHFWA